MTDITVDDAAKWHMREAAHYNGGAAFFAYLHRCVEQPRLSRFDKYVRADRSVVSTWRVDGIDHPDFAAAISALNVAPVFDEDELAQLATIPADYDPSVDVRKGMNFELMDRLRDKGAIEWAAGRCRTTAAGRHALGETLHV